MVSQEFSTAAFRVGHSQISNTQMGIDNSGNVLYSQTLGQAFNDTAAQVIANGVDGLLRNLSSDPSQATDVYVVDGLRNELLAPPDTIDLVAIDIQRGRDLGLNTLNETRQALGLAPYTSFAELTSDPTVQANLQAVYGSIDKVDLFMGGLAENHAPGAVVGPTFQAIIAAQFTALRAGDRFFWQNEAFDPATARMIGSTTLSDIIRRNTKTPAMQQDAFIATQRHSSDVAAEDPNAPQLVIGVDTAGATIAGGPADDTIVAGLGADQLLTGGGGKDVFMFIGSKHVDTITDYSPGVDRLDFTQVPSGLGIHDLTLKTAADGSAVVHFNGNSITLAGVRPDQLSISDFLFNDHAATAQQVKPDFHSSV